MQGFSGGVACVTSCRQELEASEAETDDNLLVEEAESDEAFVASSARASESPMARSAPMPSATRNGVQPMVVASPAPPPIVVTRLGDENADRLRAALSELIECRQLLDRVLSAG